MLLTDDLIEGSRSQALGEWDGTHCLLLQDVGALGHHKTKLVGRERRIFLEAGE
jgi:hypothetical protein